MSSGTIASQATLLVQPDYIIYRFSTAENMYCSLVRLALASLSCNVPDLL